MGLLVAGMKVFSILIVVVLTIVKASDNLAGS